VLTQLEAALREAGSGKDCLLAVTVLLKDLPVGRRPFAAAFNQWVDRKALPAMTLLGSYLGRYAGASPLVWQQVQGVRNGGLGLGLWAGSRYKCVQR